MVGPRPLLHFLMAEASTIMTAGFPLVMTPWWEALRILEYGHGWQMDPMSGADVL